MKLEIFSSAYELLSEDIRISQTMKVLLVFRSLVFTIELLS
jgi:hypothetical protein